MIPGAASQLFSPACWYKPSPKAFAPPSCHDLAAGTEKAPLKIEFCLQHHPVLHYGSCLRLVAS